MLEPLVQELDLLPVPWLPEVKVGDRRLNDVQTARSATVQGEGRALAFAPGKAPNWTNEQREILIAMLGAELVDRVGLGSAEIDQILRKELKQKLSTESASELAAKGLWSPGVSSLFSGVGASWSAQPFSGSESVPSEAKSRTPGPSNSEWGTFAFHSAPARTAAGVPS